MTQYGIHCQAFHEHCLRVITRAVQKGRAGGRDGGMMGIPLPRCGNGRAYEGVPENLAAPVLLHPPFSSRPHAPQIEGPKESRVGGRMTSHTTHKKIGEDIETPGQRKTAQTLQETQGDGFRRLLMSPEKTRDTAKNKKERKERPGRVCSFPEFLLLFTCLRPPVTTVDIRKRILTHHHYTRQAPRSMI